jgi:hypothetical protein
MSTDNGPEVSSAVITIKNDLKLLNKTPSTPGSKVK